MRSKLTEAFFFFLRIKKLRVYTLSGSATCVYAELATMWNSGIWSARKGRQNFGQAQAPIQREYHLQSIEPWTHRWSHWSFQQLSTVISEPWAIIIRFIMCHLTSTWKHLIKPRPVQGGFLKTRYLLKENLSKITGLRSLQPAWKIEKNCHYLKKKPMSVLMQGKAL